MIVVLSLYKCFQVELIKVVEGIYQFCDRESDTDNFEKLRVKNDKIIDFLFNGKYIKVVSHI